MKTDTIGHQPKSKRIVIEKAFTSAEVAGSKRLRIRPKKIPPSAGNPWLPWEAVRQCFRNIIPAKAGIQKSACPLDPGLKNAGTSFAGMTTEGTVPILRHPLGTGRAEISVKHLMGFFGADRVSEIRTTRISKYIESRLDEDASNATINRELTVLKQMLNLGAKSTPPKVDRVPRIPMLRENNVRKGFF
mgnify:CR=1 FL=1